MTGRLFFVLASFALSASVTALPASREIGQNEYDLASVTDSAANEEYQQQQQQQQTGQNSNTTTILNINFASNFSAFNPRNSASLFEFLETLPSLGLKNDGAAYLASEDGKFINSVAVPFDHWLPQSFGPVAALQALDVAINYKNLKVFNIAADEVLSYTLRFKCRGVNNKLAPFPKAAIAYAEDDPRLATCGMNLIDVAQTGLNFGIVLTNKGIWLTYQRQAMMRAALNANFDVFAIDRRAGSRRVNDFVNARIDIDRSRNETRYYVNDKLAWTVGNWGILSNSLFSDGRSKLVVYSAASPPIASPQPVVPNSVLFVVGQAKTLDQSDPNRRQQITRDNSTTRFTTDVSEYSPALVRLTNMTNFYDPNIQFYDENSLRNSSLWGEGSIAGLSNILVQLSTVESLSATTTSSDGENIETGNDNGQDGAGNPAYSSQQQQQQADSNSTNEQQAKY